MAPLSPRLQMLLQLIPPDGVVADIGADHGRLALAAAAQARRVIASEYGDGPYQRLCRELASASAADSIVPRQGNGLQVLEPAEADTVVIAGMGGDTIAGILQAAPSHAASMDQYILQPMTRARAVRALLSAWGWPLTTETVVWEDRRPYVIMCTHPGQTPYQLTELELELGPGLLTPPYRDYLEYYRQRWRRIAVAQAFGRTAPENAKRLSGQHKLEQLEGIINGIDSAGNH